MQVHNAEALALTYGVTSTKTRDSIGDLSPLITEALALLEEPGQNPLYGPIPALNTVANELTTDKRDLAWRLDWIKTKDGAPIDSTGRINVYAPSSPGSNNTFDLDAALAASGLTEAEQQHAKEAILNGEDFTDAIDTARQRTHNDNMAAFRRMEAQAWTETEVELTPIEQAEHSLNEIRDLLDTAKQDKGDGVGSETGDGIWSTNDLKAMVENEHGYYTDEQVEHARRVLAMVEASPDAREHLGITESGGGWSLSDIGHLTLDVFGMVPVIGNAADAANAAWYLAEGDYLNAGLSAVGMLPGIGQAAIAAKATILAAAGGIAFKSVDEAVAFIKKWLDEAGILRKGGDETVDVGRGADSAANRATHEEYLDELRDLEVNGSPGPDGAVRAADEAQATGATNGAAAQFDVDGNSFTDVSGSNTPLHPDVQNALDDVPASQRSPWHEGCAEPRCVSQALDAGLDPSTGVMNAVQIGDNGMVPHGNLRPPCPSCIALRNTIGYTQ